MKVIKAAIIAMGLGFTGVAFGNTPDDSDFTVQSAEICEDRGLMYCETSRYDLSRCMPISEDCAWYLIYECNVADEIEICG